MRCSIGIAPNRYLAKVGTELQKPDGLVVLRAEDLPQRLFTLKLRDLPGVGANIEHRIQMAGIMDLPGLFALNPRQMRKVWGSVWGEKMWYLLRGMELPEEITARRSVGHSHVMAPELRDPDKAKDFAKRGAFVTRARPGNRPSQPASASTGCVQSPTCNAFSKSC